MKSYIDKVQNGLLKGETSAQRIHFKGKCGSRIHLRELAGCHPVENEAVGCDLRTGGPRYLRRDSRVGTPLPAARLARRRTPPPAILTRAQASFVTCDTTPTQGTLLSTCARKYSAYLKIRRAPENPARGRKCDIAEESRVSKISPTR